ncbi:hypothetical protein [Corynebacterium lubricantis]|uniref:hypothetical protein n=1 Tax=Corynebacterium lubricantis TaxID=541095 RepID=UPI000366288D|nr:hypothetical protein [Corynebacterium lubricantis]
MHDDLTDLAEAVGVLEPEQREHPLAIISKAFVFVVASWILLCAVFLMAPMTPGSYPYA